MTLFSILILGTYGFCPNYTVCAYENKYCGCTDTMYYGVSETWVPVHVSIKGGSKCSLREDPVPGTMKWCLCTDDWSQSLDTTNLLVYQCAWEGNDCECSNGLIWYGSRSVWKPYHEITDEKVPCTNEKFGNVYDGDRKRCVCVKQG